MVDAIVGKEDHLVAYLNYAIARATRIRFNVAFIMESGVKLIAPVLQQAAACGAEIQILTGPIDNRTFSNLFAAG